MTSAPRSSYPIRRTGSTATAALATIAGFAVILGTIGWLATRGDASRTASPIAATSRAEAPRPSSATIAVARPALSLASTAEEIVDEDPEIAAPAAESIATARAAAPAQPQPAAPVASLRDRVAGHLAVGEFGPALDLAHGAGDAAERAALLGMIAQAQSDAGEFQSALAAIRRMPLPAPQLAPRGEPALSGGGAGGANFGPLIDLIQQQTTGPWFDIDGVGGTISEYATGVRVDPNGHLHRLTRQEQTDRLRSLGVQARRADLNEDMDRPSGLRLVSLSRLEREVERRLAAGQPVVETMRHLAGLSRIEYVFLYPEQNEIVVGGPAEGWRFDEQGTPVGLTTGKPTMQLDDLVTVLRIFAPEGEKLFICAIVPRKDNMQQVQEFVAQSQARGPLAQGGVSRFAKRIEQLMGAQDVEFSGVPVDSRVAHVILEADYRMKLIGIGKLDGGPKIKSFFELLSGAEAKNPPPTNAMRWWLTMKYDAIRHSADRDVFAVEGSSVLCRSEDEIVTAQGDRVHTGQSAGTNRAFAANFTQHYADLAQRDPVFADLQNVFDLSLVAALIQEERLHERAGWDLGCFSPKGAYQPAVYAVPKTVDSVVNHRVYNGKDIVVQAAGGVRGDLLAVVHDKDLIHAAPQLDRLTTKAEAPQIPAGRWWWDAPVPPAK
ncbi:MAG: DUF1598 domain-containing protein [Planctomycetales bacterium]